MRSARCWLRELGYGEFATIGAEDRNQVELEAEQHVNEWERCQLNSELRANIRPITPLRRLFGVSIQHICERILDEQEIEVGILGVQETTSAAAGFSLLIVWQGRSVFGPASFIFVPKEY